MPRRIGFTLALLLGTAHLAAGAPAAPAAPPAQLRLVVVIAVDQLRADYLDRFESVMPKGFRTLRNQGVVFTDAHHEHAVTATAPGHATLATGAYPSHSGIVGNEWYEHDGRKKVYCVDDRTVLLLGSDGVKPDSEGKSPANLRVTALPDWIKQAHPQSRVFTASRKDRAAVLLGGRQADTAFWYDPANGEFISSTYYREALPDWTRAFNRRDLPARYFGTLWQPLPAPDAGLKPLDVSPTDAGWFKRAFPHAMGDDSFGPDASFYADFGGTPFMDRYLEEFAEELVRQEKLGQGESIDYLGLSFSALDSVGHEYGPNSPEALDQMRRLDEIIGNLLAFLDAEVGLDHIVLALSADHGVMDLPEYSRSQNHPAHRIDDADIACLQVQGKEFLVRYGAEEDWYLNGYYLNYAALGRHNLRRQDVEQSTAALLEKCPLIRKVWTRTELEQPSDDYFQTLFRHSFYAGRSPDLLVQPEENTLTTRGLGTSHGTPYAYDTHVPLLFLVPGVPPRHFSERVATVDLAPTLAGLIGVPAPESVDGHDLHHRFAASDQ